MTTYERHELSAIFGDLPADEYDAFVDGLRDRLVEKEDGLWLPGDAGVIYHAPDDPNAIIDGYHRYRAAMDLNAKVVVLPMPEGVDIAEFVLGRNLRRRHLTPSQRATVALKVNEAAGRKVAPQGRPKKVSGDTFSVEEVAPQGRPKKVSGDTFSVEEVAQQADVSPVTVKRALAKRRDAPDGESKGPSPTERLKAEVDQLHLEKAELARKVEDLEAQVAQWKVSASDDVIERDAQLRRAQAVNSGLRAEVATATNKADDYRREAAWWNKQAKALGWEAEEGKTPWRLPDAAYRRTG